ncbi:MAG: protein TolR [Alphaproteobacteria bacterium]|jgi:biopolymer transport protein TolR|nr:protein TolR [Alphaproteobacteria bacterium]MDP6816915.1 protein TolR [Alphaproteobacteria bacterium]|tara:strand:+ start:1447 stop:1887 length:441 start_codon:yes stop_codon:yes gene_type:complete
MGADPQLNEGRRRRRARAPMSQINVTPFVDVMLVLLVIFMITAPLLTVGVQVDLPETVAGPIGGDDEPLAITITREDVIFLQESEIQLGDLVAKLMAISERRTDTRIFLRADSAIPYGRVMQVMGTVNQAGFKKVALVTKLEKGDK